MPNGGATEGVVAMKRKKSTESMEQQYSNNNTSNGQFDRSSGADMQNADESGDEESLSRGGEAHRKKKARTTFTGRQIFELEKQFELKKYLSSSERAEMAKLLNVTETQVSE